jgi:hypothetical protein
MTSAVFGTQAGLCTGFPVSPACRCQTMGFLNFPYSQLLIILLTLHTHTYMCMHIYIINIYVYILKLELTGIVSLKNSLHNLHLKISKWWILCHVHFATRTGNKSNIVHYIITGMQVAISMETTTSYIQQIYNYQTKY